MTISDEYDINRIILEIEAALLIDGKDYGEKDVDIIMNDIYGRIIRQYQLDLKNIKISDESLYLDKSRSRAVLFVDNMAALHSKLCGYFHLVRFNKQILIRPININYMGFTRTAFMNFLIASMSESTMSNIMVAMKAIESRFGSINSCTEKKLILIMIVCYRLGFYELLSVVAEIFYLGGKI